MKKAILALIVALGALSGCASRCHREPYWPLEDSKKVQRVVEVWPEPQRCSCRR